VIVGCLEALDGPAVVKVALDLRAGLSKHPMTDFMRERGCRKLAAAPISMYWMGATRAQIDDGCLTMTLRLDAGRHHGVVLDVSDRPIGGQLARLGEVWQATEKGWSTFFPPCDRLIAVRDAGRPFKSSRGLGQPP
jgi:alpha,alpha-trehalase